MKKKSIRQSAFKTAASAELQDSVELHSADAGYEKKLLQETYSVNPVSVLKVVDANGDPEKMEASGIKAWHTYASRAIIDGEPVFVKMVVREGRQGRFDFRRFP